VKKENFKITLKGLMVLSLNEEDVNRVMDSIELYMRRNDNNAIVFHDGVFSFEKVEKI